MSVKQLETSFSAAVALLASLGTIQSRILTGSIKSVEFFLNYEKDGRKEEVGVELTLHLKDRINFWIAGKEVSEGEWVAWLKTEFDKL